MIDRSQLISLLVEHLPGQRWFSSSRERSFTEGEVGIVTVGVLRGEWPGLVRVLATVSGERWQLLLGLRPPDSREPFFEGKPEALLGALDTDLGPALAYDATIDPELALVLLGAIAPGEEVERARPLMAEQSNTSVVYDERLILKLFRRLVEGPNPDAEVSRALARVGFANVAEPVAEWRVDGDDCAIVNTFLSSGSDGFSLALTSLRDLYDRGGDPREAGGDFGPDARRLGIITAKMHLALAEAFGTSPSDPAAWARDMVSTLDLVDLAEVGVDAGAVRARYERLGAVAPADAGPAVRVHGDYHLGQVLRTDAGWFVLDFEGEPQRPLELRRRPTSVLRDVAGMLRSLHYAASVAAREWGEDADDEIAVLAAAWEAHNGFSYVEGYLAADGIDALLPAGDDDRERLRSAFELDKAVYEVGYEQAHRPDWVEIPVAAVRRLLSVP